MDAEVNTVEPITVECARRSIGMWIPTNKYLPRSENPHHSEYVLGVYMNNRGAQEVRAVYYNWRNNTWMSNSNRPPFEFEITHWFPFPSTPENGGEVFRG